DGALGLAVQPRLFTVHVGRQPDAIAGVDAPAVHVQEDLLAEPRPLHVPVHAVVADDVVLAILDPDATREAVLRLALRADVEDERAHLAEELAAHEPEVVALAVERGPVRRRHGGKAVRDEAAPLTRARLRAPRVRHEREHRTL